MVSIDAGIAHGFGLQLGQTITLNVLGREITPQRINPDTLPAAAQMMRPMFDHYDEIGLRGSAITLAAILGREPRTLRAYFEELAAHTRQARVSQVRRAGSR